MSWKCISRKNCSGYIRKKKERSVIGVLAQDPRPAYVQDPERLYGVSFAGYDVKFKVENDILTVQNVEKIQKKANDYVENPVDFQ